MEALQQVAGDAEFAALPTEVRTDVRCWLDAIEPLLTMSRGEKMSVYAELAGRFGVSLATVRNKVAGVRKQGWRALVNEAKVPVRSGRLPYAFLQFWKKLCEENQRNCKQAYNQLIARWKYTVEPIPGYPVRPQAAVGGIPQGWSYGNLMKKGSNKFELTAARIGRSAAGQFRQKILSTRRGLECGQFYVFDDLEHDLKVNFIGVNRRPYRPLELCCLDLFSARKIAYGLKPIIEGDDGAKQKLKGRDMRFLLAHVLTQIGYRRDGTTLVVEHGTAAISEKMDKFFSDETGGAISIERSGIEGAPLLHGWYEGRGKGNFRLKAALESQHSLVHNITAALPGQMGKDRGHSPEELHGREVANQLLLEAVAKLPQEKIEKLRFGFLHFHVFHEILDDIYRLIDLRTEHDLEGFVSAGLVTEEYRLDETSERWLSRAKLLQLPPDRQEAVKALIDQPGMMRCRKLSPMEVWTAGSRNLVKWPIWSVPDLLGEDLATELKVNNQGSFEFEDQELSPEPMVYVARAVNRDGHEVLLKDGEKYQVFINPFNTAEMIVCDARGAYIGICHRMAMPCKADPEALFREMGKAAHTELVRSADFRARHLVDVARKIEDERQNKLITSGAPVTPAEKATAARIRAEKGDLADIYGKKETTEAEQTEEDVSQLDAAEQVSALFGRQDS